MKKLLAIAIVVFGMGLASVAGAQVALPRAGWVATASTTNSGEPASRAIDGSGSTRWSTGAGQTAGQWFSLDMITPQSFSQITIDPTGSTNDWTRGYQVFVSNDAVTWGEPVASGTGAAGVLTIMFPTQTARFVGIVQTGSVSNWWSIGEVNVYGPGATPTVQLSTTGWVATASATGGSDVAGRAIDGQTSTRWSTGANQVNGQWFQVDMLQQQSVASVVMNSAGSGSDYARGYQIFVSNDPNNFGTAVASGTGTSAQITATFSPASGRYLRIVQTGTASNWWSIAELTVYGVASFAPAPQVFPRTGWVATASSTCASDTPNHALDDDVSTRWSTGLSQTNGMFFQVDMLTARSFTKITLDAGSSNGDYPRAYSVYVSQDGTNWGSAVATGTGSGQLVTITFASQNARYIKIVQSGSSSNWWSIHELNVYGIPPYLLMRDGWVASASLNSSAAGSGIDGRSSTRWTTNTNQASGQWYQVDMLAPQTFNQVKLDADGSTSDYPRGYQIFASNDPTNFGMAIASGVGTSSIVQVGFASTTARYIRVVQTGSASNYWSIAELNVLYQLGLCDTLSADSCVQDVRALEQRTRQVEDDFAQATSDLEELVVTSMDGDNTVTAAMVSAQQALVAAKQADVLSLFTARDLLANDVIAHATTRQDQLARAVGIASLMDFRNSVGVWTLEQQFDDCGDVVIDQRLTDLVDAVLSNNRVAYGIALAHIETALQCETGNRARILGDALTNAYSITMNSLPVALQPTADRILTSIYLNLFLMIQDDIKMMGPTSVQAWLKAHRSLIGQVAAEPNSMVRLAGLWLRHPSGDTLIQLTRLCEDGVSDPRCVSVGHLVDALTDPRRFVLGTCSAMEMVTPNFDPNRGYKCTKSLCQHDPIDNVWFPASTQPFQKLLDAQGRTRFGLAIADIQTEECGAANSQPSDGGGGSGDGSDLWPTIGNCFLDENSTTLAQEQVACVADAAFTDPFFRLNSVLQNNGWPMDACHASAVDPGDDSGGPENGVVIKIPDPFVITADVPKQKSAIQMAMQQMLEDGPWRDMVMEKGNISAANIDTGAAAVSHAVVVKKAFIDKQPGECKDHRACTLTRLLTDPKTGLVTKVDSQILVQDQFFLNSDVATIAQVLIHEGLHAALGASLLGKIRSIALLLGNTIRQHAIICSVPHGCNDCNPDDDSCGSCSPASAALRNIANCFAGAIDTVGLAPVAPIVRLINPTDDQNSGLWSNCFGRLDHGALTPASPICTMVHCAPDAIASFSNDACSCTVASGGAVPPLYDPCTASIMCADSTPVALPGGLCRCSTSAGDIIDGEIPQ
jgi:hypothetical protein